MVTAVVGLLAALAGLGGWLGFIRLARFLGPTRPVAADWLIVEGWLSDRALEQASQLYFRGSYSRVLTTGPPVSHGALLMTHTNFADISRATLIAYGLPAAQVVSVPCPSTDRFRTATAAAAVAAYLQTQPTGPRQGINLVTAFCHARRSSYIYRQELSPVAVGVVALAAEGFDPQRWWRTSAGVRTVVGELVAYLYARWVGWQD